MSGLYGLWLETRNGFFLVGALAPLVVVGLLGTPADAEHWRRVLDGPLFVTFGLAALTLVDGLTARPRVPPGLHYTLSLPIARRRLFLGRTLLGLAQGATLVVGGLALVWALVPGLRANVSALGILEYAFLVWGGQTLSCGARVLLSTFVGPGWSLAAMLVVFEAAVIARINVRSLPEGHLARAVLESLFPLWAPHPGLSLALCVAIGAGAVWLALARFERHDF